MRFKILFLVLIFLLVSPMVGIYEAYATITSSFGLLTKAVAVCGQKEGEAESKDPFIFRPISSWIGERFIFLPASASIQKYGYSSFNEFGAEKWEHPEYDKYVGRIVKVISVVDRRFGTWDIGFEMEDDGRRLTATVLSGSIHGIALVADVDNARSEWLGKTLWYAKSSVSTYNEETEKFGSIKLKKYSPVKVIGIGLGWYNSNPVKFVLKTASGEVGFIDINLSGTNVSEKLRGYNRFENYFGILDPRTVYKWSNKVWVAIEEEKVFIGMTSKQGLMSWGKPRKINVTVTSGGKSEQWVYVGSNYLYFENGILTGIQK